MDINQKTLTGWYTLRSKENSEAFDIIYRQLTDMYVLVIKDVGKLMTIFEESHEKDKFWYQPYLYDGRERDIRGYQSEQHIIKVLPIEEFVESMNKKMEEGYRVLPIHRFHVDEKMLELSMDEEMFDKLINDDKVDVLNQTFKDIFKVSVLY